MWHEFTIAIFDRKMEEMGINETEPSKATIDLDTVVRFYKTYDDQGIYKTMLVFQDGDTMQVDETYQSIKDILCK